MSSQSGKNGSSGPKVSIVIPVRNGARFIVATLESALAETSFELEVIVAENFSTDGTAELVRSISDSRVRFIPAEEPLSAAQNWTRGCLLATGEWVKVLSADDLILEGGLARQFRAVAEMPDVVLVASRRRVISDDGRTVLNRHGLSGYVGRFEGQSIARRAVLSGTNPFGETAAVMFRREALEVSLPFTESFPYLTDLDMYIKVLNVGNFLGLSTIDAAFRLNRESWSAAIGDEQLSQHQAWVDGHLRWTANEGRLARLRVWLRLRARFLARKIVTGVSSRRRRSSSL